MQSLGDANPLPVTKFDPIQWGRIAGASGDLPQRTKSLASAAHCFSAHWGKTWAPTSLTPDGVSISKGLGRPDVYQAGSDLAAL